MLQRQYALQESQDRLVTGKRVLRASDDPTAAARVERALTQQSRVESSQRALEVSRSAMLQAESAVGTASDILQQVRDLVVEAGNAAYTDSERADAGHAHPWPARGPAARGQPWRRRRGLLFAGQGSQGAPFVEAPQGVEFRGNPGQAQAVSGEPLPTAVDGQQAFLGSPTGNGVFVTAAGVPNSGGAWIDPGNVVDPAAVTTSSYAGDLLGQRLDPVVHRAEGRRGAWPGPDLRFGAGHRLRRHVRHRQGHPVAGDAFSIEPSTRELSVFDTLQFLGRDLATPGLTGAQIAQAVSSGLRDLDSSMATISAMRSGIGAILQRTDEVETRLSDSKLLADDERSAAEDLGTWSARCPNCRPRQTGCDAALKAYSDGAAAVAVRLSALKRPSTSRPAACPLPRSSTRSSSAMRR
jgi:flagellar hook-associated protein 3 FlgL